MMSFVIKIFKTIKTHWKKSIFFTAVGVYGVKYAKELYEDDLLRRQYCAQAKLYGEQKIGFGQKNRKITVFLNPAANGGRARKLFEKNAAPLLHLAGLEVNVVKTEYEGQIKEFMKVFERKDADGIAVAGGNGSVLETFRRSVPLGVIPVGVRNFFGKFLFGSDKQDVRRMLDSAMAIVYGMTQRIDVIKIQGEDEKSTYALGGLEAGEYRDAFERKPKYWYFGPLKHRFTYLRSTLGEWPPNIRGTAQYVLPSDPNSKPKAVKKVEEPKRSWSWRDLLFSRNYTKKPVVNDEEEEEEEEDDDDDADHIKMDVNTVEFNLCRSAENITQEAKGIEVTLGPSDISKTDFIKEGWRRIKEPDVKSASDSNQTLVVKKFKFTPTIKEGKQMWYDIDGEHFEAMPIEVTLLKKRLKIFTLPEQKS